MDLRFHSCSPPSYVDGRDRPGALTQFELLYLAGRCLRQLAELHGARHLETCEMGFAMRDQFRGAYRCARLSLDESARRLPPTKVRLRNDGGREYRWMAIQHIFNFDA